MSYYYKDFIDYCFTVINNHISASFVNYFKQFIKAFFYFLNFDYRFWLSIKVQMVVINYNDNLYSFTLKLSIYKLILKFDFIFLIQVVMIIN